MSLRIGTRGSALALAQARYVASLLGGEVELVTLTTAGDVDRAAGDKSRWTGALEQALLAGEIDLAVHSAKDVPGEIAPGTALVAAPPRLDPRDVLVGASGLHALPAGCRVGTSALRRRAQLLAARPDLDVVELRGNVDTRLRKLVAGEVDALVLAAAGLERLGTPVSAGAVVPATAVERAPSTLDFVSGIGERLASTPLDFVPAPGQGTLALQAREGDHRAVAVNDASSWRALLAERAAVVALGASCHTPVGLYAGGARLRGFAGLPDGSEWVLDELDAEPSEEAGRELAARMLAAGAGDLLARAAA